MDLVLIQCESLVVQLWMPVYKMMGPNEVADNWWHLAGKVSGPWFMVKACNKLIIKLPAESLVSYALIKWPPLLEFDGGLILYWRMCVCVC